MHVSNPTKFGVYKGWAPKKIKEKEKRSLIFTLYVVLWELNLDAHNTRRCSSFNKSECLKNFVLYTYGTKVGCHNSPQIRVRLT